MRAVGDTTRCMASGYCQQVAPDVFELDEETGHVKVKVDVVPPDLEEDVREAESLCPMIAISVQDD